jgi:hypothetical protein
MLRLVLAGCSVLLAARSGFACPVCNTDTGALVRAGIFDDDFVATALGTLAPFPVILGIVAALRFGTRHGVAERAP